MAEVDLLAELDYDERDEEIRRLKASEASLRLDVAQLGRDLRTAEQQAARLRDSLARTKEAHDATRLILGANVESIQDAAARVVRERNEAVKALRWLVELKDGPRDVGYRIYKPQAWDLAREIVEDHDTRLSPAKSDDTPAGA